MEFRVTCITKRGGHLNSHERIQALGGGMGYKPEDEMIRDVQLGAHRYYVLVQGHKTYLLVRTHQGRKYLATQADSYWPDNLLALPECSR